MRDVPEAGFTKLVAFARPLHFASPPFGRVDDSYAT
jgi:hypothetical protein